MLKKPGFYLLWFAFLIDATLSVAILSFYKFFGLEVGISDYFLAVVGSVAAIFNGLGRLVMGLVADKASYKFALVHIAAIMSMFLLTLYSCTMGGRGLFLVWICVLNFCIGGNFNVLPSTIVRAYGIRYASVNYGLLFTSILPGGCAAALLSTLLISLLGFVWFFFLVGVLSAVAYLMTLLYRPKRYVSLVTPHSNST